MTLPSGLFGGADPGASGGLLIGEPRIVRVGAREHIGLRVLWTLPFKVPARRGLKVRAAWAQVRVQLRACPFLSNVKLWALELPQQGATPGENRGRLLEMLESASPETSRIEDADPSPHGWPKLGRFHGAGNPKGESRQTAQLTGDWFAVDGLPPEDALWDAYCLARWGAMLQAGLVK